MANDAKFTVLHYLGYDDDRGGIVAAVRALATAGEFACVLGMNRGFQLRRARELSAAPFEPLSGERITPRMFWRARKVATQVRHWLAAEPGRIFHGHSRAGLVVGLWLVRRGERRVVVSVHCYGRQRWFYRWAARKLGERLYWLSPAMMRYYGAEHDGDRWSRCIPPCAATDPGPPRAACATTDAEVRLGGIGALVRWKRWHLVLDALAALPEAARDRLRFVHVGATDGSRESERYAAALRRHAEAARLAHVVEWRGELESARTLLSEIDCLVVASHREPCSVAMLEALFAGVPVLAANSGGARDVIQSGRNGWLFCSGDARDLARALGMLVESDARRRIRIDPAELARFSARTVARQWLEVYRREVANARRPDSS